jgi:hypothetical protein
LLPQAEKEALLELSRCSSKDRAKQFMRERGFRRIARSSDDELQIELDQGAELLFRRYMREGRIQVVELGSDGDVEIDFEPSSGKDPAQRR